MISIDGIPIYLAMDRDFTVEKANQYYLNPFLKPLITC